MTEWQRANLRDTKHLEENGCRRGQWEYHDVGSIRQKATNIATILEGEIFCRTVEEYTFQEMLQNVFDRRDKKLEWLSEGDKIWLGKAAGDLHMCLKLVPIVHLLLGLLKPNLSLPTPQNQGNILLMELFLVYA